MRIETLPVIKGEYQLQDYEKTAATFDWKDAEDNFSWINNQKINIAYEAIDRHVETYRKNKVALYYKDADRKEAYTYYDMKKITNQAANVFQSYSNLEKGDRLFIFMPRSPELYFSLFGALKLGLIVGPLFESFMQDAVYDRLLDSEAKAIVTTPDLLKRVPLDKLPQLETVFLVGGDIEGTKQSAGLETQKQLVDFRNQKQLIDFESHLKTASKNFKIEWMTKDAPTLLHYTSSAAGKAKGVILVQEAMVQQLQTTRWVLDLNDKDIYWCTADPGWVTGTVYGVFGPMLAGATTLIHGKKFSLENWYEAIEEYGVTVWYSAPTAFRMLMGASEKNVKNYDLSTLRHILSVGEPLNPEIIRWGMDTFKLKIHDTWCMTETGALLIANFQSLPLKLGSMGKAIPGIEIAIVDNQGNILPPNTMGNLAVKKDWPSMMRGIWNREELFESYFMNDEWYISGDTAYVDEDGYFWFQGRTDDVIMTSSERIGPFEIEMKLAEHEAIVEAGVVGKPDPVHGEIIKAFIVLKEGYTPSETLKEQIQRFVRQKLAAQAVPKEIEFQDHLPKTRSGKIIRRALKSSELPISDES